MLPRFKTVDDWEKAQIAMQPCLIRVIDNLRKYLEDRPLYQGSYHEVADPIAGYQLHITQQGNEDKVVIDIWQLCFRICFLGYSCSDPLEHVEIDPQLFDEPGDLNWENLEDKTKSIIGDIFLQLDS